MDISELYHHGIKGMKWGVRRYQNADGSLTAAGQKRYDRDIRENNAKKKDNRIKDLEQTGPDPKRWAREDLERSKKVIDANSDLVKEFKKLEQVTTPAPKAKKLDLSKMSDKELRDKINRELLEQQYNKLFADTSPSEVSKGRTLVKDTLEVAGSVLAIAGSSLSIALAIKELRG